jgi:hypothetical protein
MLERMEESQNKVQESKKVRSEGNESVGVGKYKERLLASRQ